MDVIWYNEKENSALNHNYIDGKCECGEIEFKKPTLFIENGVSYVFFGKYPQTVETNLEVIASLENISITNSLGYIEYNGNEYIKMIASTWSSSCKFINNDTIIEGATYYFKVEPIKWRVLESKEGTYTLISNVILDNPCFYNLKDQSRTVNGLTIYPNNYEFSNIRAWLNGYNGTSYNVNDYTNKGFIDIAFTYAEMQLINSTLVDNSLSSTGYTSNPYTCDNTTDKVYLLSYSEATNSKYGLSSSSRLAQISDFVRAKGIYFKSNYNGNGYWWLRSPLNGYDNIVRSVKYDGSTSNNYVDENFYGVRPVLNINL